MRSDDHLITMHTTDEQDRLWVTCSCGWNVAEIMISDDNWKAVQQELADDARAHVTQQALVRK